MRDRPAWYRRSFRFPFSQHQLETDVSDELHFHLEMRTEKLISQGMAPDEARAEAQRRFGTLATIRRDCLEIDQRRNDIMRLTTWWDDFRLDLTYALRSLGKKPTFALAAVLTLGIGIGATTAIFSLLDAVVLRPLPMPKADRLVLVTPTTRRASPGLSVAWQKSSHQLAHLTAFYEQTFNLTGEGIPELLVARAASASYLKVLGVQPILGRGFLDEEDSPAGKKVAVLSHRLWSRRFASDTDILGRSITLSGVLHTVIGVLPAALDLDATSPDLFVPLALPPSQENNFGGHYLTLMGRMTDTANREEVQRELAAVIERLDLRHKNSDEFLGVAVSPLSDFLVGPYSSRLWVLFAAGLFVLLITCSNVASLLLARCSARTRELGIRASLGAGRGRIAAQLLNESLVLTSAGGALGLLLAWAGVNRLVRLIPAEVPRLDQAQIDGRVLTFALLLTVGSSLVAGLAPAWRSARLDLQGALRGGGHSALGHGRDRLRSLFVVTQVSLSLLLLTAAGLLLRSSVLLKQVPPGFATEGVLTAELALPESDYPDLARARLVYTEILDRVAATPGIETAAFVSAVPLAGSTWGSDFALVGQPQALGGPVQSRIHLSSPGYFAALGIPLVSGRDFSSHDRADSIRAILVNETLAYQLTSAEPASLIGQQLYTETYSFIDEQGTPYPWRIVGIVSDVRDQGLRSNTRPAVYLPLTQAPSAPWAWIGRRMLLVARTKVEPQGLVANLKSSVNAVDPRLPLYDIRTMEERLAGSLAIERFNTWMLSGLGLVGLLLAAVGIYGLVAFFVGQRRREIGVRIALGATTTQVRRLVIQRGMGPVLIGVLLGLVGARGVTGVLESQLYGIDAADPMTFITVCLVLLAMAWLACYPPALQASRTEPREVLRQQ